MDGRQKPIGRILQEMELISESQVQEALAVQRTAGGVLGEILVRLGYVAREEVLIALAAQIGMEVVDLFELPPRGSSAALEEVIFERPVPESDVHPLVRSQPVAKLVGLALSVALGAGATEIRFEVLVDRFQIRYRVDGVLYEMECPPRHLAPPMLTRLKLLTGLTDIRTEAGTVADFDGRRYYVSARSIRAPEEESIVLRFSPIPPPPPPRYLS